MSTLPTQLPVPSETPRDLKFNAGKIDEFVTALVNTYVDRFGQEHYTIEGFRWLAQQAISNLGYITLDSFEDGATLTLYNQVLRLKATGEYYRWDGAYPPEGKVVPAGSTPDTTGGIGLGKWLSVGDGTALSALQKFKSDLLLPDGAKNIGHGKRTLLDSLNDILHSGDYTSLQETINTAQNKGEVLISPGEYAESIIFGKGCIEGVGPSTLIKPNGNFSKNIQFNQSIPQWQYRKISNFGMDGDGTLGVSAMSFNPDDQYSGRMIVEDVYISNYDRAIEKPSGNIGNTFRNISISNCNWGYHAKGADEMHAGCDTLERVHFEGIQVYCVYIDSTVGFDARHPFGGGLGAFVVRDCILEGSPGGGFYIKGKPNDCPTAPVVLENLWIEAIATGDAVQVDGVAQKPRVIKAIDCQVIYVRNSYINNIELTNSNLITYGCRFDNGDGHQDIVVDSESCIIAHDAYLAGASGINVIVESVAGQKGSMDTASLSMRGNTPRGVLYNIPTGNKLNCITFSSGGPWELVGNASVTSTAANDGMLFQNCAEFNMPGAAILELSNSQASITVGRWYVWACGARLVSGNCDISISGGITLGDVYNKPGEWIHTFGVGKATRSEKASLRITTGAGGAVVRLEYYYVVEFATQAQAIDFANSRMVVK